MKIKCENLDKDELLFELAVNKIGFIAKKTDIGLYKFWLKPTIWNLYNIGGAYIRIFRDYSVTKFNLDSWPNNTFKLISLLEKHFGAEVTVKED